MNKEKVMLLVVEEELKSLSETEQAVIENAREAIRKVVDYYGEDYGGGAVGLVAMEISARG